MARHKFQISAELLHGVPQCPWIPQHFAECKFPAVRIQSSRNEVSSIWALQLWQLDLNISQLSTTKYKAFWFRMCSAICDQISIIKWMKWNQTQWKKTHGNTNETIILLENLLKKWSARILPGYHPLMPKNCDVKRQVKGLNTGAVWVVSALMWRRLLSPFTPKACCHWEDPWAQNWVLSSRNGWMQIVEKCRNCWKSGWRWPSCGSTFSSHICMYIYIIHHYHSISSQGLLTKHTLWIPMGSPAVRTWSTVDVAAFWASANNPGCLPYRSLVKKKYDNIVE